MRRSLVFFSVLGPFSSGNQQSMVLNASWFSLIGCRWSCRPTIRANLGWNIPVYESCWAWTNQSTDPKMRIFAWLVMVMPLRPLLFENHLKKPACHAQTSLHCKWHISMTLAGITKWLEHTTPRIHSYNQFKFEDLSPTGLDYGHYQSLSNLKR